MQPRKIKVVDVINDIDPLGSDIQQHTDNDVKAIENVNPEITPEPIEEPISQPIEESITQTQPIEEKPVSDIKTVELVECPDCNKKMAKKSLKYSHAKNCHANKQPKEETKEEEQRKKKQQKKQKKKKKKLNNHLNKHEVFV